LKQGYKIWLGGVVTAFAAVLLAAFVLPESFRLAAFCDLLECALLASATAAFLPMVVRAEGRIRAFWFFITLGVGFWFLYQVLWTYYEVWLRQDVPDLFVGDLVLFINIVPLMAGLALRPHTSEDEYAAHVGRLDFAVLGIWWLYLYVLVVMPWQYAEPDPAVYNRNLNSVYLVEKGALLLALIASWATSRGIWKKLYGSLFGAYLIYAASSYVANWAIEHNRYYSGSLYDIPLATPMAWLTWIALRQHKENEQEAAPANAGLGGDSGLASLEEDSRFSTLYGVSIARLGMVAVSSLPLFAFWSVFEDRVPPGVRSFRLVVTLITALLLGVMVFVRQYYLDRELIRLLQRSRESFDSLKRLQAQILQSEKLASIGKLVGGAAHELNNPITAMLGYSDLLLATSLSPEQQPLAARIGQSVRRTRSLVATLISFAGQGSSPKTPVDLNTLVRAAIKLTEPQREALQIEISATLDSTLPRVIGDSNQLLQVCLQMLSSSLLALGEDPRQADIAVRTACENRSVVFEIASRAQRPAASPTTQALDGTQARVGFGLSACQGIVQEHRGQLNREVSAEGVWLVRIELPASTVAPGKTQPATVPVMWQSQPFA